MGVAVDVGDFEGGVGEQFEVPAGSVDQVVVSGAEQDQIVEAGGSAVAPEADVVCVAPGDFAVTSWVSAAAVAFGDGAEHVERDCSGGTPNVEWD